MQIILKGIHPKFLELDGEHPLDSLGRELQKISFPVEVEGFYHNTKLFVYLPEVDKPEEEWSIDWFDYEEVKD